MTHHIIRPTNPEDIPALREVLEATGLFPDELLPDMLSPFLGGAAEALWLTSLDGSRPAGFSYSVAEDFAPGTWNMLALAMDPARQGRGHGTALVRATEDHLRASGARLLIVDTSGTAPFTRTRRFYATLGYDEEARIRDFWAAGDDKVTFRKAL